MRKLGIVCAVLGAFVVATPAHACYEQSVIEAYEAGFITYNELPDSMKSVVLKMNSERGEDGRINTTLRCRAHIDDAIEFNDKYQDLIGEIEAMESFDDSLVGEFENGEISYDELLDSQKSEVLHQGATTSFVPATTRTRTTGKYMPKGRVLMAETVVNTERASRSIGKFRPYTGAQPMMQRRAKASMMKDGSVEGEKTYLTRRSYYLYDKRDMQVSDYIRLRNRRNAQ